MLPKELIVFLAAAAPLGELRGSIPLGILAYKMSITDTFFWSVLGSVLPAIPIYAFGNMWIRFVEKRQGFLHRLTDRVLGHTRHFKDSYAKYGAAALPIFVAIPLPGMGVWTGALGAFLLGIPFKKAFPLILIGDIAAGIIVTLAVTGSVGAFKIFA